MRDERDVVRPGLAALSARIRAARVFREQQLWEAAKAVAPSLFEGHVEVSRGRLAALADANAMVDGALFLENFVEPIRSVSSLDRFGGRWRCTIRCELCGAMLRYETEHADLAATLLCSLLKSYRRCEPPCTSAAGGPARQDVSGKPKSDGI